MEHVCDVRVKNLTSRCGAVTPRRSIGALHEILIRILAQFHFDEGACRLFIIECGFEAFSGWLR